MKYFPTIFAVLFALATVGIFIAFIRLFIAWLGGGFNILLPGLGLVVSGGLILVVLLITGIIMLSLTVLLWRTIYKPVR
jgi:hypothetical protein